MSTAATCTEEIKRENTNIAGRGHSVSILRVLKPFRIRTEDNSINYNQLEQWQNTLYASFEKS